MSETLGIGYIGFGDHCNQSHAPYLGALSDCETVGIADLQEVNVDVVSNLAPNPLLTKDYHDLLDDDCVNAVVISTRDDTHYRIARDAIEAGKHTLVEKPAAATRAELARLPSLCDRAQELGKTLWVCHPREFGEGPWSTAAQLISDPVRISEAFAVGPMGQLRELRHDCQYTVPNKQGVHMSFADDKLNHTLVSVQRSLPGVTGFRNAMLLDNGTQHFDARLVTVSDQPEQDGVVVRASGPRSAHSQNHGGGVYRDWIEAVFDEGTLRVEPSLGRIALTYGKREQEPLVFDPHQLYNGMFGGFNRSFVDHARGTDVSQPLTRQAMLLGTAAAILMQESDFAGNINETII